MRRRAGCIRGRATASSACFHRSGVAVPPVRRSLIRRIFRIVHCIIFGAHALWSLFAEMMMRQDRKKDVRYAVRVEPPTAEEAIAAAQDLTPDPVQQVEQQRPARDRVKHLVRIGAHARALPGGKDNDGEAALFGHRAEQWHGTNASASAGTSRQS